MLLCREKNDYTLFDFNGNNASNFANDIFECFANRGVGIVNAEVVDCGVAMEIWVKKPGQKEEADLYYLFPADQMVITYWGEDMEEMIIVRLNPVVLEQEVYIMSNNVESVPLIRKCTLEELAVLDLIKKNSSVKQSELAEQTGKSVRSIKRIIDSLKEKQYIRRVDGKRYGKWEVLKESKK